MTYNKTESVTTRLPKDWKLLAQANWDASINKFNYSTIIKNAMHEYYKKQGWLND